MAFPDIEPNDLQQAIPEVSEVEYLDRGGQKLVFSCTIGGERFALKVLQPSVRKLAHGISADESMPIDDVTARARREVATMKQCDTPYLVKIGPLELQTIQIDGEDLLYFSEELVDGTPLNTLLIQNGPLSTEEVVMLGQHVVHAIDALWSRKKIHRDIKPGNIMRRNEGGFVVLDLGLVFDLDDDSYSLSPVGTHIYFSPEQMDFENRREVLDFRSDLFSLGITLYEMATGVHPFVENASNSWDVVRNIRNLKPSPPHERNADVPESVSQIIMRLLGKRPALRYRNVRILQEALSGVAQRGGQ